MTPTERDRAWARLDAIGDLIEHLKKEQSKEAARLASLMRTIPDGAKVRIYNAEDAIVNGAFLIQCNDIWHVYYACKVVGKEKYINCDEEHITEINPEQP